jgi:hypothetical protein
MQANDRGGIELTKQAAGEVIRACVTWQGFFLVKAGRITSPSTSGMAVGQTDI